MSKFRKCCLLSVMLSLVVSAYGCSGNSSQTKKEETKSSSQEATQNKSEDAVKTSLEKAIDKYYSSTYSRTVDVLEVGDPSILSSNIRDSFGDSLKSVKWEYEDIYELKKDSAGKVTDYKIVADVDTTTVTFVDGSSVQTSTYIKDGFQYEDSADGKVKFPYVSEFESIGYELLSIDNVKDISLTTENSQRVYKFNFNSSLILARYALEDVVRSDSGVELVEFSGTLIENDKDSTVKFTIRAVYKDKSTGATLTDVIAEECNSTITGGLKYPEDLSSYQEV